MQAPVNARAPVELSQRHPDEMSRNPSGRNVSDVRQPDGQTEAAGGRQEGEELRHVAAEERPQAMPPAQAETVPAKGRRPSSRLDARTGRPEVQEPAEEVQAVRPEEDEERPQPDEEVGHENLPPENEESPRIIFLVKRTDSSETLLSDVWHDDDDDDDDHGGSGVDVSVDLGVDLFEAVMECKTRKTIQMLKVLLLDVQY